MSRINRTRRIAMLSPIAFALAFGAYAQETNAAQGFTPAAATATADAAPSTAAFMMASAKLRDAAATPYTGDADLDFVHAMIPSHEGTVEMARVARDYGDDPEVRMIAEKMIEQQQADLNWMVGWLEKHGNQ